jgi:hypothetical protein
MRRKNEKTVYDIYKWWYLGISNGKWTSMYDLYGERDYFQYGGELNGKEGI